eukprot:3591675-Rhodomonas_salina.1
MVIVMTWVRCSNEQIAPMTKTLSPPPTDPASAWISRRFPPQTDRAITCVGCAQARVGWPPHRAHAPALFSCASSHPKSASSLAKSASSHRTAARTQRSTHPPSTTTTTTIISETPNSGSCARDRKASQGCDRAREDRADRFVGGGKCARRGVSTLPLASGNERTKRKCSDRGREEGKRAGWRCERKRGGGRAREGRRGGGGGGRAASRYVATRCTLPYLPTRWLCDVRPSSPGLTSTTARKGTHAPYRPTHSLGDVQY